ncbi:MAG: PilZ domain-containing protein [Alphaproteobacteria bacterium]|jgi:hypothetical protein|nr:PilZ domain-containing protein [Alphaproteobacteria bacterium]
MLKLRNMFARNDDDAALAGEAGDGERRNYRRHHIDMEVLVDVDRETHRCHLYNVAPGGAFLSPDFDAEVGTSVTIRLPNSRVVAVAGVTRVSADGIGVRFDDDTVGAIVAGWTRGMID